MLQLRRLLVCGTTAAAASGPAPQAGGVLGWPLAALEGMAQTAALLGASVASGDRATPGEPPAGRIVAVRNFLCHGDPPPEADLRYETALVRRVGRTLLLHGRTESGGTLLAEAEFTLWIGS